MKNPHSQSKRNPYFILLTVYRYIKKKNECKYQILIWFITIFNLLRSIYNWPIRNNRWWRLLSLWNYINEEKLQNKDNCIWYLNSHLIYGKAEVLEFCPKSPMLDFMVNHSYFFIFVTWISLIIIGVLGGIHENVGRKIETSVVFFGRNGGSRAQPGHQVVSIFFFCLPWIPPKFQFFLPPFSWIPTKIIK